MKQTQSSADPQMLAQFVQLLRTFSDKFWQSKWDIGKCEFVQHKIDFYLGSKQVKFPNYRMPMHLKKDLRQKIYKFFEHNLMTPCHSPCSSSAKLINKTMVKSGWSLTFDNWTAKHLNFAGHCLLLKKNLTLSREGATSQLLTSHGVSSSSLEKGILKIIQHSVLHLTLRFGSLCQGVSRTVPAFSSLCWKKPLSAFRGKAHFHSQTIGLSFFELLKNSLRDFER